MPQLIVDEVDQIRKKERNTHRVIFMDRRKIFLDVFDEETTFNLENKATMSLYLGIKAELPQIDVHFDEHDNNKKVTTQNEEHLNEMTGVSKQC